MSNEFIENPALLSSGYCDSFALVMHKRCGWQLGAIVRQIPDLFDDEDWTYPVAAHAVLIDPQNPEYVFDSKGYRALSEVMGECLWSGEVNYHSDPYLQAFNWPSEEFCFLFSSVDELAALEPKMVEFIEHHGFDQILQSKSRFDATAHDPAPQP